MLAGYDHLIAAARRLQWDADAIDLRGDAQVTPRLPRDARAVLTTLVGGFCVAETAVAAQLGPYVAAAGDPAARECFAIQAVDEARHARFFERIAGEVLGLGADAARHAPPAIGELFGAALPAAARALAADATTLPAAVGLYHLVLEGIVFAVGQDALLELARAHGLRGVADGVGRVQGDERWHVGLGVLALQRLGAPVDVEAAAGRALGAWGPAIATAQRTTRVLAAHRRRVGIAAEREAITP